MKTLLGLILSLGALHSTQASASFFAHCSFDVQVATLGSTIKTFGQEIKYREVGGKITRAETAGPSHIDCAQEFLNQEVTFNLLLHKGVAAKELASFKEGDTIKIDYQASNGLTPWGVEEEIDWWLVVPAR